MVNFSFKGQISILIIIAIIIVLGGIFIFTLTNNNVVIFEDQSSSYKIKQFVESCLDIESSIAINKIGDSGGWLYHPEMIFTDIEKPDEFNKRADGMDFFGTKRPYWFYYDDTSENFIVNIPQFDTNSQYSIRNQIKRYLDDNLERNCIQSFNNFEEMYNINYEPKQIMTNVEFRNDEIIIDLEIQIEIEEINTGNVESVKNFQVKKENILITPYNLARDITLVQANESIIEKRIMQFLNPYMDSNSRDLLPPKYDFKMTYDFRPWNVEDVEILVKRIIESSLDKIQFMDTDYRLDNLPIELQDSQFAKGHQKMYLKEYYLKDYSATYKENRRLFNSYKDYTVQATFNSFFPFYFDLAPSSGNIILLPKPQAIINFIPFFFTEYVAVYEIINPIVFEIDDNPYDTFVFNFAIESNIDHNSPLRENYNYILNEEVRENLNQGKTLICDPPQFISNYISLNITDPIVNGERKYDPSSRTYNMGPSGIEGGIITFDCKGLASCYVGQTQINPTFQSKIQSELRLRLPINCDPGKLEIYKFGHKKLVFENINPSLESPISLGEFEMPSRKDFKTNIKIKPYTSPNSDGRGLNQFEEAFIIFQNLEDNEIMEVLEVTNENQFNTNLSLLPGNYSVEGFLISSREIIIPSERFCYKKGIFGSEDCQDLPSITLESWLTGGIEIDRVEFKKDSILNRNRININFVDLSYPLSYADLEASSNLMADLKFFSSGLKPELE
jgi:hypothetical protein